MITSIKEWPQPIFELTMRANSQERECFILYLMNAGEKSNVST